MSTKESRYHFNPNTGNVARCGATTRACPYGAERHFPSREEARKAYEEQHPALPTPAFTKVIDPEEHLGDTPVEPLAPEKNNIYYVVDEGFHVTPVERTTYGIVGNHYKGRVREIALMGKRRAAYEDVLEKLKHDPDSIEDKQYTIDALVKHDFYVVACELQLTPEELSELQRFTSPKPFESYKRRAEGLVNFWKKRQDLGEEKLRRDYTYTTAEGEEKIFSPTDNNFIIEKKDLSFPYYKGEQGFEDEVRTVEAMTKWYEEHRSQSYQDRKSYRTEINELYVRRQFGEYNLEDHKDRIKDLKNHNLIPPPLGKDGEGTPASVSPQEAANLQEVKGMEKLSLQEAEALYEKYRQETTEKVETYSEPVKGILGWMGAETTKTRKVQVPTPRALEVSKFYDSMPTQAREQFTLYQEAKQRGASPAVLAQASVYYQLAYKREAEREAARKQQVQRLTDRELLERMKLSAEESPLDLPPTNFPLPATKE